MKKLITILAIAFTFLLTAKAQTSFSCIHRDFCDWNENTQKYDNCKGYDESSLFVMNKDETMFVHTIEDMKSTYYVSDKEYDKALNVFTYFVTSDVGNKYMCVFDIDHKEIRMVSVSRLTTIVVFYVKAIF